MELLSKHKHYLFLIMYLTLIILPAFHLKTLNTSSFSSFCDGYFTGVVIAYAAILCNFVYFIYKNKITFDELLRMKISRRMKSFILHLIVFMAVCECIYGIFSWYMSWTATTGVVFGLGVYIADKLSARSIQILIDKEKERLLATKI